MAETARQASLSETLTQSEQVGVPKNKTSVHSLQSRVRAFTTWLLLAVAPAVAHAQNPVNPEPPVGPKGSLILIGGGAMPKEAGESFMDLAEKHHRKNGKSERPKIIVLTTASDDRKDKDLPLSRWWTGPERNAVFEVLHHDEKIPTETSDIGKKIRESDGVFFPGGKQRRLADMYSGTDANKALEDLLQDDGVVAGTSAGTSIMTDDAILDETEGVANIGRGFDLFKVPNKRAVLDQHFWNRNRGPRLRRVLNSDPNFLGIGVDERTAIIREDIRLRVVGEGNVRILTHPTSEADSGEYIYSHGQEFTLPPTPPTKLVDLPVGGR